MLTIVCSRFEFLPDGSVKLSCSWGQQAAP